MASRRYALVPGTMNFQETWMSHPYLKFVKSQVRLCYYLRKYFSSIFPISMANLPFIHIFMLESRVRISFNFTHSIIPINASGSTVISQNRFLPSSSYSYSSDSHNFSCGFTRKSLIITLPPSQVAPI